MAEDVFHLPGSSYLELCRIIRAYGDTSVAVGPEEISQRVRMHPTIISRNNGFLVDVGIVLAGKKKQITPPGKTLARALEHELPDEVARSWGSLLLDNDFFSKILSAVRIRNGMDRATLVSHVAYTAGQSKTQTALTGAAAVIEILQVSNLLEESDGKFNVVLGTGSESEREAERPERTFGGTIPISAATVQYPGVQIVIQLEVTCRPEELTSVAPMIKALISSLSAPDGPEE